MFISVTRLAEWTLARNWSIKAEYVYLGFRRSGNTLVIPGGFATRPNLHTVKGGINYRFQAPSEIIGVRAVNLLMRSSRQNSRFSKR